MKPKRKGIAAQFMKGDDHEFRPPPAASDATAVSRPARGDNTLSTMDEHGVEDIVGHLGDGAPDPRATMSSWNPADPWSADNPEVAKALRADDLARKRKLK